MVLKLSCEQIPFYKKFYVKHRQGVIFQYIFLKFKSVCIFVGSVKKKKYSFHNFIIKNFNFCVKMKFKKIDTTLYDGIITFYVFILHRILLYKILF